jgi:hypothetical protein
MLRASSLIVILTFMLASFCQGDRKGRPYILLGRSVFG